MSTRHAILDVEGANCPSCVYAIEHSGRKVAGVNEVRVDPVAGEIHVDYQGHVGSLERISEIVRHLGYRATIRWSSIEASPAVDGRE